MVSAGYQTLKEDGKQLDRHSGPCTSDVGKEGKHKAASAELSGIVTQTTTLDHSSSEAAGGQASLKRVKAVGSAEPILVSSDDESETQLVAVSVNARMPEVIGSRAGDNLAITEVDRAEAYLIVTFGAHWRNKVHRTHNLSLAEPVVFCRCCGRSSGSAGTLRGLQERCPEDAKDDATRRKRARRASNARHPRAPSQLLREPVPIDPGRAR